MHRAHLQNLFVKSNLSGDFLVLNRYLVNDLKAEGLWNREMSDQLKYFDGELGPIQGIPDRIKKKYSTAFDVSYDYVIAAAAAVKSGLIRLNQLIFSLVRQTLRHSHMYRDGLA